MMHLEKYAKAGIIAGIILVVFAIAFGIVPSFIDRYEHRLFEENPKPISEDKVLQVFLESKEYQAFSERFPDHETEFSYSEKRDSNFSAIAYNQETQNALVLYLRYDLWDEGYDQHVECSTVKRISGIRYNAENVMVTPFIKSTNCLD